MQPLQRNGGASIGPESLALAKNVFEQTWIELAPRFSQERHTGVRDALASAMMTGLTDGNRDLSKLREAAMRVIGRMYPVEMHMTQTGGAPDATAQDFGRQDV
jgi:hypothetical protein